MFITCERKELCPTTSCSFNVTSASVHAPWPRRSPWSVVDGAYVKAVLHRQFWFDLTKSVTKRYGPNLEIADAWSCSQKREVSTESADYHRMDIDVTWPEVTWHVNATYFTPLYLVRKLTSRFTWRGHVFSLSPLNLARILTSWHDNFEIEVTSSWQFSRGIWHIKHFLC